ncbi:MAG: hypothetical protein OES47_03025 [Acidobacteriota bacterium]|nr:hypothetical protein [Acidobacteriota bacterium]
MSLLFYKVLHILAILFLFTVGGGVALYAANGGSKEGNKASGLISALHGLGLLVALVSGFGMWAKLGVAFSGWLAAKITLWFVIGLLVLLPYRKPEWSKPLLVLLPILGAIAAYLALYKPF